MQIRKPRARLTCVGWMVHDEVLGAAFGPTLEIALRLWFRCRLMDLTVRA